MNLMQDLATIKFWPYLSAYFRFNYFVLFLLGSLAAALYLPKIWKSTWRTPIALSLIYALGIILRILWVCYSPHEPRMIWAHDVIENDLINLNALDLLKGIWFHGADGLPYGRRPIGYPLFLALVYKVGGPNIVAVWSVHILLFCATLFFLHRLTRFVFNAEQALLPAFFYAIYPTSIYAVKLVTDENLFLPLWFGALYFFMSAVKANKPFGKHMVAAIFLSAYATLIRTHAIFMPALYFLAFLFFSRSLRKAFAVGALAAAILFCMNAPWLYRNYKLWKVPVMFTATSYFVYAQVNSTVLPDEGAGKIPGPTDYDYSPKLAEIMKNGNEGEAHQLCNKLMKKWIVEHPVQFGVTGIRKLLNLMNWNRKAGVWPLWYQWTPEHYDATREPSKAMRHFFEEAAFVSYYLIFHWWFFGVAVWAFYYRRSDFDTKVFIFIIGGCLLFWFAEHMIIYADRKYRYPLEPLMIILGCRTLFWVRDSAPKIKCLAGKIIPFKKLTSTVAKS